MNKIKSFFTLKVIRNILDLTTLISFYLLMIALIYPITHLIVLLLNRV